MLKLLLENCPETWDDKFYFCVLCKYNEVPLKGPEFLVLIWCVKCQMNVARAEVELRE